MSMEKDIERALAKLPDFKTYADRMAAPVEFGKAVMARRDELVKELLRTSADLYEARDALHDAGYPAEGMAQEYAQAALALQGARR